MCVCINNDDFMHNKCFFLLNYRTHFYHCNYLRSLKSNKTAHKILIAAQKFKKKSKFVRFCKDIFDEDNFDKYQRLTSGSYKKLTLNALL